MMNILCIQLFQFNLLLKVICGTKILPFNLVCVFEMKSDSFSLIMYVLLCFCYSILYSIPVNFIRFLLTDISFIAFCSSQQFCSVGDDSCLILWDARIGTDPVVKVGWALLDFSLSVLLIGLFFALEVHIFEHLVGY